MTWLEYCVMFVVLLYNAIGIVNFCFDGTIVHSSDEGEKGNVHLIKLKCYFDKSKSRLREITK